MAEFREVGKVRLREVTSDRKVPRPPPPSSPQVSKVMRSNKAKNTLPERTLRRCLRRMGLRDYRIAPALVPGRPDVTFKSRKLAVFVNGCFWHQCPHHHWKTPVSNPDYWSLKLRLNKERDARKIRDLEAQGWKVLTIWECEIRADAEGCANRVTRLWSLRPILRH